MILGMQYPMKQTLGSQHLFEELHSGIASALKPGELSLNLL